MSNDSPLGSTSSKTLSSQAACLCKVSVFLQSHTVSKPRRLYYLMKNCCESLKTYRYKCNNKVNAQQHMSIINEPLSSAAQWRVMK